jgi:hypothetical protein
MTVSYAWHAFETASYCPAHAALVVALLSAQPSYAPCRGSLNSATLLESYNRPLFLAMTLLLHASSSDVLVQLKHQSNRPEARAALPPKSLLNWQAVGSVSVRLRFGPALCRAAFYVPFSQSANLVRAYINGPFPIFSSCHQDPCYRSNRTDPNLRLFLTPGPPFP